jgi:ribosomal-protein-alanine N-acetyltransferase
MVHWFDWVAKWISYDADRDFYAKIFPDSLKPVDLMRLRKMRKTDLAQVMPIELKNYEFPWGIEVFKSCFNVSGYSCWVCEDGETIVAYAILSVVAGEAHILNISVEPQVQGFGVGYKMMNHLIKISAKNAQRLFLEVRPSNTKARTLYTRLGFNSIGLRKDYYPTATGREDALMLALDLNADTHLR